jgi:signal transduction histidine kinase/CheY-like chemotaxis protein
LTVNYTCMKKFKLLSVGTSGISNEGDVRRIELVNALCLVCAGSILGIGSIICYCLKWQPLLVFAFAIEFILNGSVLLFNYFRKHTAASVILYFLQCIMIIYLSILLGRLLQLELVIVLLFAITYLIFKQRVLRRIAVAAALADLVILEIVYYNNPSPTAISISHTTSYIIQILVLVVITYLTVLVSKPYVKSNDTNEELKRANHLIKIFVAQITHELRTPLDSIHHIAQLLRTESRKDESLKKIQPYLDITWTVSSYARGIVNNVLDMAEIEAGKNPAVINEAFKVAPFFEKILEVHKVIARREEMSVDLRVDKNMPEVIFSDPLNVNQILTNLLANAFKYGARKRTVIVDVSRKGVNWELKVSNYGPPIPSENAHTIFDPFVTSRTGFVQGSGLGLYIVKTKVCSMGGSILMQSGLDGLTIFSVLLPLREGKLRDLPDAAGSDADTGDLQKVHIMVAEDDPIISFVLSRFLKDMGCSYTMVSNGKELLEAAKKTCPDNCPDMFILDSQMPIINGEETVRALKNTPGLSHIPIIVTTGDIYSGAIQRMLNAGANTYLKKPIDHLALQKTIILYLKKLPQN